MWDPFRCNGDLILHPISALWISFLLFFWPPTSNSRCSKGLIIIMGLLLLHAASIFIILSKMWGINWWTDGGWWVVPFYYRYVKSPPHSLLIVYRSCLRFSRQNFRCSLSCLLLLGLNGFGLDFLKLYLWSWNPWPMAYETLNKKKESE